MILDSLIMKSILQARHICGNVQHRFHYIPVVWCGVGSVHIKHEKWLECMHDVMGAKHMYCLTLTRLPLLT